MFAYLFPGQGSQSKGMGKDLFNEFPDLVKKANKILEYSVQQLCLEDPNQQLNQTQYTQPAIYIVNALSYFKKNKKPDYVSGHSLGEYNALLAADIFDFETGLKLVKKRGELMSQVHDGAMAAIIGLTSHDIDTILKQNQFSTLSIANYNSYLQHVISGPKNDLDRAQKIFSQQSSVSFIPLRVSGSFHSPYMSVIQKQFSDYLNQFTFKVPKIPVIANIDAKPYHPAITKSNLVNQLTHPVQWTLSMEYFLSQNMTLEEIGIGGVLTGLLKRIRDKK